jgi:nucleoside 2-deoxyribosyltransferase
LFREHNISVCSRWLQETVSPTVTLGELSSAYHRETAQVDLDDVDDCDIFVFFSEDPLSGVPRGGRHVEFGYALAKGKRIAVIGPEENTFHYLSQIQHYLSVQEFLDAEGIENVQSSE